MELLFRLVVLSSLVCHICFAEPSVYQVGAGIADVTGPAADINMVCILYVFVCCSVEYLYLCGRRDACVKLIEM
jgi:hypothetical protein